MAATSWGGWEDRGDRVVNEPSIGHHTSGLQQWEIQEEAKYSQPKMMLPLWTHPASPLCAVVWPCPGLVVWPRGNTWFQISQSFLLWGIKKKKKNILHLREQVTASLLVGLREWGQEALSPKSPPSGGNWSIVGINQDNICEEKRK